MPLPELLVHLYLGMAEVEPTKSNLSEVMVHLTNYAINKANPNFEENTNPDDAEDGHKRSWEAVQEHLRKEGHDVDTLLLEIEAPVGHLSGEIKCLRGDFRRKRPRGT